MKLLPALLLPAGLALALSQPALAHGDVSCNVPRAERQPSVRLQQKLKTEGWKIRKIQIYQGCYEVYGKDDLGIEVEAFFDPRTLARIDA